LRGGGVRTIRQSPAQAATLEEISDAALLLHVVDSASPLAESQFAAVEAVVGDLGATAPSIAVFNKADVGGAVFEGFDGDAVSASAKTRDGVATVLAAVDAALAALDAPVDCLLPFSAGALLEEIHRTGTAERVDHTPDGTRVSARVPPSLAARLAPFAVAGAP
jgi:GTP-binding protein HflX